ncbi:class I SAM-dependent methyltransferase [Tepidimonas fonticaldi]|uniref:class I SAM-dependent methyltransferase n=1 Tax=Tepidimonas fonticaldi TaxID=1101373 RepID=UPI0018D38AFB|nr:class I SAM-dependent methyltransferase [Tepidimonas fonticaldi]
MDTPAAASLKRLSEWIAADPGDVLDLGMGTGSLGRYLNGPLGLGIAIDGVTVNPAELEPARPFYRQCWLGDLEVLDVAALLGERRYRWVVCADVLEHLRNPERLADQCRHLLQPSGELLVSIPNASYAGLIADLIHGRWQYGPEGLLDKTHVRFFTRQSFTDLLHQTGWQARHVEAVPQPWHETEFHRPFDHLPPSVARYILAQPHSAAYQWIFRATPATDEKPNSPNTPTAPTDVGMASYSMTLYIDDGSGYRADHCIHALGTMGKTSQTISFPIPPGPTPQRLRLDPADRPGYWNLRYMQLTRDSGDIVWQWHPNAIGRQNLLDAPHYDVEIGNVESSDGSYLRLVLTGDDPQFDLPIKTEDLQSFAIHGGTLTIVCDWPWSADYLAAIQSLHRTAVGTPTQPAQPPTNHTDPRPPARKHSWLNQLWRRISGQTDA